MTQGLISIRNEDGTQWYVGEGMWSPQKFEATPFPQNVYRDLQTQVEASTRNNSPDNGFFGLMNLTWHEGMVPPPKPEGWDEKVAAEDAEFERQWAELEAELGVAHCDENDLDPAKEYAIDPLTNEYVEIGPIETSS